MLDAASPAPPFAMIRLRSFCCSTALSLSALLLPRAVSASLYDETYSFTPNVVIPDGNLSGIALSQTISGSSILSLDDVEVTLNLSGGLNGDYYVYLVHSTPGGTGFSVLLNRVGRTSGQPFGYGDSGLTVTFSGSALNDIHTYQTVTNPGGGALTGGLWSPDGRNVDPANVVTSDARTATLDSIQGLDANGTWTLFLADVAPLGQGVLVSWELHLQGVPEPGTVGVGAVASLWVATMWWRRGRRRGLGGSEVHLG